MCQTDPVFSFLFYLLQCCVNEDIEGVRLLLRHGAKVNIQDNDLWTPLHVAAACDNAELVELLLEVSEWEGLVELQH